MIRQHGLQCGVELIYALVIGNRQFLRFDQFLHEQRRRLIVWLAQLL